MGDDAAVGETDADACAYNDFALVRIDPADVAKVNPSIPHWGGPVGLDSDGLGAGERVYTYGNSSLRFGITQLSPKTGMSLGTDGERLEPPDLHRDAPASPVTRAAPCSTPRAGPPACSRRSPSPRSPVSNNFGDLSHELAYMRSHGGPQANVVNGTEAFDGSKLPLGI